MAEPSLFIGVVSYPGSRFADSQGPAGLAHQLSMALDRGGAAGGIRSTVVIDTANRHDASRLPITELDVEASLDAQADLREAWALYLHAGNRTALTTRMRAMASRFIQHIRRHGNNDPSEIVRLINIEFAHRALLQSGIDSGASWILILEDDASAVDVQDCAMGLQHFIETAPESVQFVNLSQSFDLPELGVDELLTPSDLTWKGNCQREVLNADRPITNTVCAILYRTDFAEDLLQAFDDMPLTPVIPIDWKLNQALMKMFDAAEIGSGSCVWIHPGPIIQRSMHDVGSA